jgi:hypothetical protein
VIRKSKKWYSYFYGINYLLSVGDKNKREVFLGTPTVPYPSTRVVSHIYQKRIFDDLEKFIEYIFILGYLSNKN